jgi:hypothetical protein
MTDLIPQNPTGDSLLQQSPEEDLFQAAMAKIKGMEEPPPEAAPGVVPDQEQEEGEENGPETQEGDEEEVVEPETPEQTPDDSLDLGFGKIDKAKIKQLYDFEQFLLQNPEVAVRINEVLRQPAINVPVTATTPPPPPEPTIPDFIDQDDPAQLYLVKEIQRLNDQYAQVAADFQQRRQQEDIAAYERAKTAWNAKYNFSAEELSSIEQEAGNLRIMAGLITGGMTIEQATDRTLDTALRSIPEIYDRYLAQRTAAQKQRDSQDQVKKNKLGALAGRTGVTSVPVPPVTQAEKRQAMVSDIAAALNNE